MPSMPVAPSRRHSSPSSSQHREPGYRAERVDAEPPSSGAATARHWRAARLRVRASSNARPHMQRILALGGGGFLMEDAASPIDAYILTLPGKRKPKVCFVSTASGDHPDHIAKFYAAYGSLDCEPSHLAFFRNPTSGSIALSNLEEGVLGQDVVFVGGGNTKSALAVWREWHLDSISRRALSSGVLLAGMSAGAMCWFESGLTDSYWGNGYQPLPCLGFLPGACGVHYHADGQRQSRLAEALRAGVIPAAMAIDDYAGVLYQNGAVSKVLSWRHGATAYTVEANAGRVIETPHECTTIAPSGV